MFLSISLNEMKYSTDVDVLLTMRSVTLVTLFM